MTVSFLSAGKRPSTASLLASGALHPEAANWQSRVVTNGGAVSASTLAAVSAFCRSIESSGLRSRFFRLSLFCGNSLSAALVPLYRGQSLGGTQYGNTTDTNNNFVSGDYTETGFQSGLAGNGLTKYLATGFIPNTLTLGDTHLFAYSTKLNASASYAAALGSFSATGGAELALYYTQATISTAAYYAESNAATGYVLSATNNPLGHMLGTAASTTNRRFYVNGNQSGTAETSTSTTALSGDREMFVFRRNNAAGSAGWSSGVLGAYSIGSGLSAAQAATFYGIMNTFQTALGRNV